MLPNVGSIHLNKNSLISAHFFICPNILFFISMDKNYPKVADNFFLTDLIKQKLSERHFLSLRQCHRVVKHSTPGFKIINVKVHTKTKYKHWYLNSQVHMNHPFLYYKIVMLTILIYNIMYKIYLLCNTDNTST